MAQGPSSAGGCATPWTWLVLAGLWLVTGDAMAQQAPPREAAIVLHVAAPRDSSLDRLAGLIRPPLSDVLGKPVEVRHDANAMSGDGLASAVAGSSDEVRIVITGNSPLIAGRLLGYGADFRPMRDFEWLAVVARYPSAIVVRASSPVHTLDEWLGTTAKRGGTVRYGSAFAGSMTELAGRLLGEKAGVGMVHEGYADLSAAYEALRREQVDLLIDGLPRALEQAARGDVRIIAVTSGRRVGAVPQVRAFGELWPGEDFSDLVLLGIASGEQPEVRATVRRAWEEVRRRPLLAQGFTQGGATYLGLAERSVRDMLEDEFLRHASLIARFPPRR